MSRKLIIGLLAIGITMIVAGLVMVFACLP
jgi:hypothetical protein